MKHYKDIIDRQLFEETYGINLDDFNLYAKRNKIRDLPTRCDNCGDIFWINKTVFKKRLCYTEYYEKCFGDKWFCMKSECTSAKKALVWIKSTLENPESVKKRLEFSKSRRGKTYEEQYGAEVAKRVKAIIKQKRKEQPEPMLGKCHSDKAKLKMSLSKQELISKGELKWTNPITGEPCTYKDLVCIKASLWHKNIENRKAFAQACINGQLKHYNASCIIGYRWFDSKEVLLQSSYERRYLDILNVNKIYFDRCSFIIPYMYKNKVRHYNPDFTIFSDKDCHNITHIVEVKPKIFITENFEYSKKNLVKLRALEDFCGYNKYKMVVITEDQLNENKIY